MDVQRSFLCEQCFPFNTGRSKWELYLCFGSGIGNINGLGAAGILGSFHRGYHACPAR